MSHVTFKDGTFLVEPKLLAEAFALTPDEVRARMQSGTLTSVCEKGVDEDAGRWRLTFYHGGKAFRLTVNEAGDILGRSKFDATRRGGASAPPG